MTPRRPATSVRASASTVSTSSSRPASASSPLPAWMCTRRSSTPRWLRRAALRLQETFARTLDRNSCVVISRSAVTVAQSRLRSTLVVLVVTPPPDARLVTPFRCAVEPLVHAPEGIHSARVCGIGVIDDAILERKRAHARPFALVRGRIGSAHGCKLGLRRRATALLTRAPFKHRLAPVVVFDIALALLLRRERHIEIEVEIAAD